MNNTNQEIEYKFLVNENSTGIKTLFNNKFYQHIKQGYLLNDVEKIIRVRTSFDTLTQKQEGFLTIKLRGSEINGLMVRPEYEYNIPFKDASELLESQCKCCIVKKRYKYVDEYSQCWEIDIFGGSNQGLIVAELEIDYPSQQIVVPEWCTTNVSTDTRYTNANLVNNPYPFNSTERIS